MPAMSTLENISRKHFLLRKRLDDARLRYETLGLAVGEAKTRIELEPQVIGVMEELQRREHERAVGAYEELLTLFLRDVLPGHREVVMDLRTERSLPALDVYLRKGEGLPLEDALSGTGGSVTNILSAGLRFIALIRSGNRPFLVLDEPDCWIKPELAPKFAGVVQSVAEQLGVQVLMISHHDEQMFEANLPHRLRLEKNDSSLTARWAPTSSAPDWQEDQPGMRSIELINFQSHTHTIIPLSPGLTLINGDNDIGKSAIVSALRGVFDADSNDQHIQHGAKSARVILDFGPDKVLSWERFRKGSHKAVYELREPGTPAGVDPLRKSIGSRDVPEWVREFGIGLIDDLDVQLANQKEPVFLLGKTARERARALAIGGENAHVQEMLSLGKSELGEAKLTVKAGEREMENLHRARQILEPLEKRDDIIANLEAQSHAIANAHTQLDTIEQLLTKWAQTGATLKALAALQTQMPALPEPPEDSAPIQQLVRRWAHAQKTSRILAALREPFRATLPQAPDDDVAAKDLLRRWDTAQKVIGATSILGSSPLVPQMPEIPALHAGDLVARWRRAHGRMMVLSPLSETTMPAMAEISAVPDTHLATRWRVANSRRQVLESAQDRLLPPPPSPPEESIGRVEVLLSRWQQSARVVDAAKRDMEQADAELAIVQGELDKQANEECPSCGRPLDHDHSLRQTTSA